MAGLPLSFDVPSCGAYAAPVARLKLVTPALGLFYKHALRLLARLSFEYYFQHQIRCGFRMAEPQHSGCQSDHR